MLHGFHPYNILSTVLTLMYSQCYTVCISFWACTLVTATEQSATETQTNRRGIFLFTFFFVSQRSILHYNHVKCEPYKHSYHITENKVDWNICWSKTRAKYSRFRYDGWSGEMASSTRWGRQRDESRVLVRMPGWVNLLPVAVLTRSHNRGRRP